MSTVIIVGGSSGIGRALALEYARAGHTVGVTGRRSELLAGLQAEFPDKIQVLCHDAAAATHIEALEAFVRKLNGMDVFVYNAGIGKYNKKLEYDTEAGTVEINVRAFTECVTWAYRFFREKGAGQIVGISSIGGLRGNGNAPAYAASKAYMINYMEGLRQKARLDKLPIYTTDIRPGFVDTEMTKQNKGMIWVASPEKSARQIKAAVDRKKRIAYISRRWVLGAWVLRLIPAVIYEKGKLF